ncbi:hypothetical protein [Haloarcula salinisoli]|uniref:Uncharacterized protein n=1 Tax=Haloarcula salinisoli TaxID=2487746 RepID=A0A8J8CD86_9EURY|nr:hypothetical protein [Halomicroarcula salinisoli]MBX0306058.1 hypothetical protein [Halomicroarcula salinisoli]
MKISTHKNQMEIGDTTVEFANDIHECAKTAELAIVNLDIDGTDYEYITRNVVAVDNEGKIQWRIPECPDVTGNGHDSYLGLSLSNGELWVNNLNGMRYRVDPETGEIIDKQFTK